MRSAWVFLAVTIAAVAAGRAEEADPYAAANETRTVAVGQVVDLVPPGVVLQLVYDKVGELVEVEAEGMTLHVRGLAPGVTGCSITGERDRDDAPSTLVQPDGGRSGVVGYRMLVKIVVTAAKPAAPKR